MVEVGQLEIGGTIQTAQLESGLNRVEDGFKDVSKSAKSVNADFERIGTRAGRLATTLGGLAIAGATGLAAIAKGAPATAGAMAKIKVGAQQLQFAVGEALQDEFNQFADLVGRFADWVGTHPNLFSGIIKGITGLAITASALKIGGWISGAFKTFWGVLKGLAGWTGWTTLKNLFTGLGTWITNALSKVGSFLTGGISGLGSMLGVVGSTLGIGAGPLINTYQRGITGESGFLDKALQSYNDYKFKTMSRQEIEEQTENMVTV